MINILETKKAEKEINKLARHNQSAYYYWKKLVIENGVGILRNIKSYHFEKLKGERKEQYSCRLSKGYRVFFEIIKNKITIIKVLEVNKHEY